MLQGDYTVDGEWLPEEVTDINAEKPFGTSDKRWKERKEDKFPPPGAYDTTKCRKALPRRDREGKAVKATKGAFNVNAARFSEKPPGVGRRTKQPGPGQYSEGVLDATKWQKPTYNITIRRSEMQANKVHV